ncbi:hypothetical protein CROQUDRAFT_656074 [Cronartium quercuum f. sp. fusiforme G11]|uniref:Probable cytosolic iron-sulfur protein assembly protein 1 n=1 Tax=Cronartium quercuum f. sp. fusiforme G11 TaxID=708437 RepID=A0A9P6NK74_9BASI|nr:hypothetical protein CROQUDRAFT_656074 [Cronartium quercuum f. sp. fusiforme G11]
MDSDQPQRSSLKQVALLQGHSDRAWSVAWHPTQPILASSSTDKQIRLYRFDPPSSSSPPTLSDPAVPRTFVFNYLDSIPTGHTRTVRAINWNPTGHLLASGSFDSTVSIWSSTHSFLDPVPSSSSRWESELEAEHERDQDEARDWECTLSLEGHESEIKGVAWNRNGKLLATSSRDKSVWIWEIMTDADTEADEAGYEVLSVLMEHEADVKSVCWSPVEDLLCSTSYDNHIQLYAEDATAEGDFTLIHRLSGHTSTVWDASFSACGEFIASCSDDLSIRIWHREKIASGGVEGRDGGRTGGWRIGRSERERWRCVRVLEGFHTRTIYSIDWTSFEDIKGDEGEPLGYIATGGGDGKINIFEIHRGIAVSGLDSSSPTPEVHLVAQQKRAHGVSDINAVRWCKIARDTDSRADARRLLASAGDDGTTRIWCLG